MRFKLWLLLLLIVAVGATVGASVRHLKRRFFDATPAPALATSSAPPSAPAPRVDSDSLRQVPPAGVGVAERKERWATGYVFWNGEVLVTDSDGNTWSSEADAIVIHRGSVVVNGERLFLKPAAVVVASAGTSAPVAVAQVPCFAPVTPPAKGPEVAPVTAVHPDWEDKGGVWYLRNRAGLSF